MVILESTLNQLCFSLLLLTEFFNFIYLHFAKKLNQLLDLIKAPINLVLLCNFIIITFQKNVYYFEEHTFFFHKNLQAIFPIS